MILKRVGVLSVGKLMACVYAVIGLLAGGLVAVLSLIGVTLDNRDAALPGMLMGLGAILFMPILYGVLGAIGGMIMAALYNLFARLVGGVEFEFEGAQPQGWSGTGEKA